MGLKNKSKKNKDKVSSGLKQTLILNTKKILKKKK
jgi:hypothetical protein